MSVPGLIGSQYFALPAAVEKRGSTAMTVAPFAIAAAKSCTCVLCMFSPRCEPMSVMTRAFATSSVSGEPTRRAERELEADLARPAALSVGRRRDVPRAVGEEEVLEERAAEAVREERDLLGAALLLDLQELLGREVERRLPGDFLEGLLAALALAAQERLLQPVRVVEEARAARSARAEVPVRERVLGVALDLRDAAVLHVREDAALPEAELAERRDDPCRRPCRGRGRRRGRGPTTARRGRCRRRRPRRPRPRS